jgi:hypothetical protein
MNFQIFIHLYIISKKNKILTSVLTKMILTNLLWTTPK